MNLSLNGSVCLVKYWNHWRQWKMILNSKALNLSLVACACILSYSGGRGSGNCLVTCIPGCSCYKIAKVITQKQKQQNQKFYFSPFLLNIDPFLIQYILINVSLPLLLLVTPHRPSLLHPPLFCLSLEKKELQRKQNTTKSNLIRLSKIYHIKGGHGNPKGKYKSQRSAHHSHRSPIKILS